jgi:hypothetical protein
MTDTPNTHPSIQSADEAIQFCESVIAKLEAFEAILAQETAHIAAARLDEGFAITTAKSDAAGAYLQSLEVLKRQLPPIKRLAPEWITRLRERHEALRTALHHNMKTLATVKSVSEKLMRDVTADTMKNRTLETYGATAEIAKANRDSLTTPILISRQF